MLCEYGCNREAKYIFKNGKQCCENNIAKCPSVKNKNSKSNKISQLGRKHTEETKLKMSKVQKGRVIIEETKQKLSKAHIGKKHTEKTKQKMKGRIPWNKGKTNVYSKETIKKISNGAKGNQNMLGKHHSNETKRKLSQSHTGKKLSEEHKKAIALSNTGGKRSEETKLKMSQAQLGEKHPNWKGGISFEPYSTSFTKTLKKEIKKRDNYKCQNCGKTNKKFHIHHIDYNKQNCDKSNLITLCNSCHSKTNFNRDYWEVFYYASVNI